jgi:uncharacterized protein YggE
MDAECDRHPSNTAQNPIDSVNAKHHKGKHMNRNIILSGLVLILLLASCTPNAESFSTTLRSTISASGTGFANATPDLVVIHLGVDSVNDDPDEAVNQNTAKMKKLVDLLENTGISANNIQTTNYNMWVEDIYNQNGQPTGEKRYHVTNQISIQLKDLSKIGDLIKDATSAGASSVSGISFAVSETNELEQAALDIAIENARQKAEWMAEKLGLNVGSIVNVVEGGFITPPAAFQAELQSMGDGSPVPIAQGQVSLTAQVQVEFELQE